MSKENIAFCVVMGAMLVGAAIFFSYQIGHQHGWMGRWAHEYAVDCIEGGGTHLNDGTSLGDCIFPERRP